MTVVCSEDEFLRFHASMRLHWMTVLWLWLENVRLPIVVHRALASLGFTHKADRVKLVMLERISFGRDKVGTVFKNGGRRR